MRRLTLHAALAALTAACAPTPHPLRGAWVLDPDGLAGQLLHGDHTPATDAARSHLERLRARRPDHPDLARYDTFERAAREPLLTVGPTELSWTLGDAPLTARWTPGPDDPQGSVIVSPPTGPPELWTLHWLDHDHLRIELSDPPIKLRLRRAQGSVGAIP